VDFKSVEESVKPNQIYQQVFEDNKKYEFENDIYSTEFLDFVQNILLSVIELVEKKPPNEERIRQISLQVGKKTVLDILAKYFYNQPIKVMVDLLKQLLNSASDEELKLFMTDLMQD